VVLVEELRTPRLVLRQWRESDEAEMARINREPEVGRFLNRPVDDAVVASFYAQMIAHWQHHGYGPWAVEWTEPEAQGRFLGFAGLAHVPSFLAAAGTAPELGWRVDPAAWGRGLATEASLAARDDAFGRLGLSEVISVIHPQNVRSRRVAAKLGMTPWRVIENPVLGLDVDVWRLTSSTSSADRTTADSQH
jgi:RimJ/RimL family protein N-acetyltransferase